MRTCYAVLSHCIAPKQAAAVVYIFAHCYDPIPFSQRTVPVIGYHVYGLLYMSWSHQSYLSLIANGALYLPRPRPPLPPPLPRPLPPPPLAPRVNLPFRSLSSQSQFPGPKPPLLSLK